MSWQSLCLAFRHLRRSPALTITAILTIALGMGASITAFAFASAVFWKPLPYKEPNRLVFVTAEMTKRGVSNFRFSSADFLDLRGGTSAAFDSIHALDSGVSAVPKADGSLEEIRWASVTPGFFRMTGGKMAAGRDFDESDGVTQPSGRAGKAPMATIISYEYWTRRFGRDVSILGRSAPGTLAGSTAIIGVMEPGFQLFFPPEADMERAPDMWFVSRLAYDNATRNNAFLQVIGRLKPGISQTQAQAIVDALAEKLRKDWINRRTSGFHITIESMQHQLASTVRPALVAVLGAGIFLLLIACANVANLLLVRLTEREHDIAVRRALGAGWRHLAAEFAAEGVILAAVGAMMGLALARVGIDGFRGFVPASLPRPEAVQIDWGVVWFTVTSAACVAAFFGLAPAWMMWKPDIAGALRMSGRGSDIGRSHLLRSAVVIGEVALSFVLLVAAGLMFRSLLTLDRVYPGYETRNILTFQLMGSRGGAAPAARAAFQNDIQQRLLALPGVEGATASSPFPLTGGFYGSRWGTEEALSDPSKYRNADSLTVLPGYFELLRTPLRAGRTFRADDNRPGRNVVVIDETLAAKAFPGETAIGKRLFVRSADTPVEVIGVVAHQSWTSLSRPGREQIYFTDGFMGHGAVSSWAVQTASAPERYAGAIRAEIGNLGSRVVLTDMLSMDGLIGRAKTSTRFLLLLLGTLATFSAVLASIGVYGVLATVVRQRTGELGIRLALGASPRHVLVLILGYGLRLGAIGIALGLIAALGVTRLIASQLIGITPDDPTTFGSMAVVFLAIVGLASLLPARRVVTLDPIAVVRES